MTRHPRVVSGTASDGWAHLASPTWSLSAGPVEGLIRAFLQARDICAIRNNVSFAAEDRLDGRDHLHCNIKILKLGRILRNDNAVGG